MIKDIFKNYIYPAVIFSGGMIGVGFLSLPYIAMKVGFWVTLLYFLVITAIVVFINLIFCQISLKTPDHKRFPGFVGHYLGKPAEIFAIISIVLGSIGILSAYLLVGGQFLASTFQTIFHVNILIYVLIYFFIASIIIYFDVKIFAKLEFWVIAGLFLFLILIFVKGFSQIEISNILIGNLGNIKSNLFLLYGPLLFALWGIGLIPETEEMLGKQHKKNLKNIVAISTVAISVFYFLFIILILGITGAYTRETALDGLKGFLPNILVLFSLFTGAVVTFTSFISQATVLKKTLLFDLKIKHWQAFVMTCCPPFILFFLLQKDLIFLLSFVGAVLLGIDGILILMMYKKIGGKNIIILPLSLVFLLGIVYEVVYFVK